MNEDSDDGLSGKYSHAFLVSNRTLCFGVWGLDLEGKGVAYLKSSGTHRIIG